jgi:uncharacterized peroxidase-related enzyme
MPFIDVIQPEEAEGELKKIYEDLVEKRGKLAEVHKIQSLNPESITRHMDLYMTLLFGKSPLKRYRREMMAVVVSAANDCEYCQMHHGEALNHYWKDADKVAKIRENYRQVDLSTADRLLCELARDLTVTPSKISEAQVERLKQEGFSDRAILDATLIISYFNFVNRVVMGLGVDTDPEEVSGYRY